MHAGFTILLTVAGVGATALWLFWALLGEIPEPIILLVFLTFDISIGALLALSILSIQRHNLHAAFLAAAVPIAIVGASSVKILVLGQPVHFEDASLLLDLRHTLSLADQIWLDLAVVTAILLLLCNLRWDRRSILSLPAIFMMFSGFAWAFTSAVKRPSLRDWVVDRVPPISSDFPLYGHFTHAVQVYVESLRAEQMALRATTDLLPRGSIIRREDQRNIHVIIVESFVDPLWLPHFTWPDEPLSPIYGLWRRGPAGTALVPIFGNRSSNTEFEVLCGVPSIGGPSTVTFLAIRPGAALPCLPRLLASQGYATISLVPNTPVFFRAGRAFEAMGFERRLFGPDLDHEDLDGPWLSAESTLSQMRAALSRLRDEQPLRPVLAYTFVNAGHLPYPRDLSKRPDMLAPLPHNSLVHRWSNAAHYNARAIEKHIEHLRQEDPNSLVVVLGDHNPPLGPNFAGYRAGGRITDDIPEAQRSVRLHETPLIVMDRDRMIATGRLPAWQVGDLLLDILTQGGHCETRECAHTVARRLRPLHDVILDVDAHDRESVRSCSRRGIPNGPPEDDECPSLRLRAIAWHAALLRFLRQRPD